MNAEELANLIDLPALRSLRALSEHGTITAAAAALGYSQPAVSQQLRRLEQRLDLSLLERVGRGVRLNAAGRMLAGYAANIATTLDAAAGEIAELRGLRVGRVRLAAFPSASPTIIPRFLVELARQHPNIEVTYVDAEPAPAIAAVRDDRADIALTFSYPGDREDPHGENARGLEVTSVGRDRMLVLLPRGHRYASRQRVNMAGLANENWIAGCSQCRGHLLELCNEAGFTPRIAFETDNFVATYSMVGTGIGVALLPGLATAATGERPDVVVRPTVRSHERFLHLVTARGAQGVPATRIAMALLRQVISEG